MMPFDVMSRLPAGTVWTLVADWGSVIKVALGSGHRPGPGAAGPAGSEAATVGRTWMLWFAAPWVALFRPCPAMGCTRNAGSCPAARGMLSQRGPGLVWIEEGEANADMAGRASVAPATPATTIFAPSPPGTPARSPTVQNGSLRCCGARRSLVPGAFGRQHQPQE